MKSFQATSLGKLEKMGHPAIDNQAGAGDVIGMFESCLYGRSCDVFLLANTFIMAPAP